MIDYVLNFQWNGLIAILLYWVPLSLCVAGYTVRTAQNYMADKVKREEATFYTPTDRLGTLIGRGFVSICPVANIWAAMFDLAPKFLGRFFEGLERAFNMPLVPDTESAKAKREGR